MEFRNTDTHRIVVITHRESHCVMPQMQAAFIQVLKHQMYTHGFDPNRPVTTQQCEQFHCYYIIQTKLKSDKLRPADLKLPSV